MTPSIEAIEQAFDIERTMHDDYLMMVREEWYENCNVDVMSTSVDCYVDVMSTLGD